MAEEDDEEEVRVIESKRRAPQPHTDSLRWTTSASFILAAMSIGHTIISAETSFKNVPYSRPVTHQANHEDCEGKMKFIMIGDSTMARTRDALSAIAFQNCSVISTASRCDFPKFYGIPYNKTALEVPVPPHVGPAVHGLEHRGCWDCSGCESKLIECVGVDIEYHGIEFAADVEYPTNGFSLTQESIIVGYMSKRANPNCDFVVFNFGLHDTATSGVAPKIFGKQLDYVCELLLRVYVPNNLLYITSTYPKGTLQPGKWRNITSPNVVFKLNEESRRVMQKRKINVLDVATMSQLPVFQALYSDAVHVGTADQAWYRSVAFAILERSHFLSGISSQDVDVKK